VSVYSAYVKFWHRLSATEFCSGPRRRRHGRLLAGYFKMAASANEMRKFVNFVLFNIYCIVQLPVNENVTNF